MAKEREYAIKGELTEDMQFIRIDGWKALRKVFYPMKEKELLVKISVLRRRRSDRQNRYIHGVIVPVVQHWFRNTQGETYSHDEVYTWLRTSLLDHKVEQRDVAGTTVLIMVGKRFSQMNTKEFTDAIDVIVKKMDERGCNIPLPRQENLLTDFIDD